MGSIPKKPKPEINHDACTPTHNFPILLWRLQLISQHEGYDDLINHKTESEPHGRSCDCHRWVPQDWEEDKSNTGIKWVFCIYFWFKLDCMTIINIIFRHVSFKIIN